MGPVVFTNHVEFNRPELYKPPVFTMEEAVQKGCFEPIPLETPPSTARSQKHSPSSLLPSARSDVYHLEESRTLNGDDASHAVAQRPPISTSYVNRRANITGNQ